MTDVSPIIVTASPRRRPRGGMKDPTFLGTVAQFYVRVGRPPKIDTSDRRTATAAGRMPAASPVPRRSGS